MYIDYEQLKYNIEEYFSDKSKIKNINDNSLNVSEPIKPNIIEKPKDWEKYQDQVFEYNKVLQGLAKDYNSYVANLGTTCEAIRKIIPANTWVLCAGYYVGYQTSDWPGDVPKVLFVKKEIGEQRLTILKHQKISG